MTVLTGNDIRQLVLEESRRAHVGHIAPALSIADFIAVLINLAPSLGTDNPNRDRLILSKGHAALALYAALYYRGILTREQLATYCQDGTLLGTHPEHALGGIDFSTGSLGQGLSMGVGAALAARLDKSKRRVFVIVSDAECNEGAVWEAAMFAAHHKLAALTVIVDNNGRQAMGETRRILDLSPLVERWRAFGWQALDVDGHNPQALQMALNDLSLDKDLPGIIVANTLAGKGVSFMEGQVKWHYMPMTEQEYQQARAEIEDGR